MKKFLSFILVAAMAVVPLVGCSNQSNGTTPSASQGTSSSQVQQSQNSGSDFDSKHEISVVSREDGSGTRGAFIELMGIEEKDANGNKTDKTTKEAVIAKETDIMLNQVAGNEYAIGYVSLGSLNDTVKALNVDGVEATADNIKAGTYKVARPFNIATKGEPTGLAKDFIDFILSKEGQEVISKSYIAVDDAAEAYAGTKPSGKIVIAGSSSVTPVMEKLVEAYKAINANAEIEIQMTDSSAGMTAAAEGTCDIGMASRELKDSEKEKLTGTQIAIDGVAVIVNAKNPATEITSEVVKDIYVGNTTTWETIVK